MKKQCLYILAYAGLATAFLGLPSQSLAQNTTPPNSISPSQVDVLGTIVYGPPPAGFDPLTASPAELELYGYPPAPDQTDPNYADWVKLVSVPRSASTTLQQTTVVNNVAQNLSPGPTTGSIASANSSNWSGFAITGSAGTFKKNNMAVYGYFTIPQVQQAFGTCDGTYWYSSQWVGFDGDASRDVLQAGIEADALCTGGKTTTFYSAWYEWFPNAETRISSPAVAPGDVMEVEVWYTTSSPYGHAYLANYTQQKAATIAFNPPAGTTFEGNSAEWIEERPEVNGALANLTNYVADGWFNVYAYNPNSKTYYEPGSTPSATTSTDITMVCPPWRPSSSCTATTAISTSHLFGTSGLWFLNAAPSY